MHRTRNWLAALLTVSYGLRIWLAARGGQAFWPDEGRYSSSQYTIYYLRHRQWHEVGQQLLGQADHMLFRWFGLVPAFFEDRMGPHPAAVAAYFGIFSVLAIFLIWAVARRAGAGEGEALWAAYLAACANSLFYYSRHFFPYDISLCAMLWALYLGLGAWSWRNSLLVGIVAGLGFLTYNGYWWLGGCVLILHSLLGAGGWRRIVARAAWAGTGLVLPILLITTLSAALGYNLVAEGTRWGALVKGDFPFGHRVVAGYLWYAERGLLVIWLAAFAYGMLEARRRRRWGRLAWYAGGLGLVVGGLLLMSDVVPVFRIQGRQVREAVPFLCLGAAFGLSSFVERRPSARRWWTAAIALLAGVCAAWNFSVPLRQVFPDGFRDLAALAVSRQSEYFAYRLDFVRSLWGLPVDRMRPSPFPTLLRRPHPMQFRPYQYEGWDWAQRAEINRNDVAMRLVGVPGHWDAADARWRGYPGPVRFVARFPTDATGFAEPLVTTGRTGRGDTLYVRYADDRHVVLGVDHWGVGAAQSAPILVDYARPHEILLFAGFLLPPLDPVQDKRYRELSLQRDRVLVLLDGRPVFSAAESFYPIAKSAISFGVNFIGGSVAQPSFTGDILEFGPAPAPALDRALLLLAAGELADNVDRRRPSDRLGAAGPVRPGPPPSPSP